MSENLRVEFRPEYTCWRNIRARCSNPKRHDYPRYGGRGITVCDRWNPAKGGSFENFLADMGLKPEPKSQYSIERENNNGEYSPSNCVWTTRSVQMLNRRRFQDRPEWKKRQSDAHRMKLPDGKIRRLRVVQKMSILAIAQLIGVSFTAIRNNLTHQGLYHGHTSQLPDAEIWRLRVQEGQSIETIADQLEVSFTAIRNNLIKQDILKLPELRPPLKAERRPEHRLQSKNRRVA